MRVLKESNEIAITIPNFMTIYFALQDSIDKCEENLSKYKNKDYETLSDGDKNFVVGWVNQIVENKKLRDIMKDILDKEMK